MPGTSGDIVPVDLTSAVGKGMPSGRDFLVIKKGKNNWETQKMRRENVRCPVCGTVNRSLDLDETMGSMECIKCGNAFQLVRYSGKWHIPRSLSEGSITLFPAV